MTQLATPETGNQPGDVAATPAHDSRPRSAPAPSRGSTSKGAAPKGRKSKAAKQFWLKQLHAWHWISAAMSLVAMFLFSITGITLNHASSIGAEPVVTEREATLPPDILAQLEPVDDADAPLPGPVADSVRDLVGIRAGGVAAEWTDSEVYVAAPGPGSDAWVSIDRATGAVMAEHTDRGWISFINDLHKGRNTGDGWFWFIDVFSIACVIFTLTGLLLLQLHARNRPSTWPLVGIGTAIPLIIIVFFMHV